MQTHVVPLVMVVNNDVPAKTVAEAIAYFKANPGKLSFGSSGNGGAPHMSAELFKTMAGVGPGARALQGQHRRAPRPDRRPRGADVRHRGRDRAAGQGRQGARRWPSRPTSARSALPEVPTMIEAGVKGYDTSTWGGLLAPAGTPKDVIARLNAEANKALAAPDVKRQARHRRHRARRRHAGAVHRLHQQRDGALGQGGEGRGGGAGVSDAHSVLNTGRLPPALVARLAAQYAYTDLAADRPSCVPGGAAPSSTAWSLRPASASPQPARRAAERCESSRASASAWTSSTLDAAKARGIAVGYTPDVLNDCVADTAIALDARRRCAASPPPTASCAAATGPLASPGRWRARSAARSWGWSASAASGKPSRAARRASRCRCATTAAAPVEGAAIAHEPSLLELARWCDVLVLIARRRRGHAST